MKEETISCLNCGETVEKNFCCHCGQPAKVARFTLAHVLTSDFLQRIIHFDKGFFFSVKELFTRPGHSVREYIDGKRVSHLNYFSLLIIVILLFSMIEEVTPFHFADLSEDGKEMVSSIEELVKKHPKIVYIGIIPFYALFSFLLFRKARQNYAEHFVLNTFKGSALLILTTLFIAVASFVKNTSVLIKIQSGLNLVMTGYGTWFYYQYFSPYYSNRFLLFFRSVFCVVMPLLLIVAAILIYRIRFT
jgi:Protein of unknown function (DUF3667)